jgi:hypothetical protein
LQRPWLKVVWWGDANRRVRHGLERECADELVLVDCEGDGEALEV